MSSRRLEPTCAVLGARKQQPRSEGWPWPRARTENPAHALGHIAGSSINTGGSKVRNTAALRRVLERLLLADAPFLRDVTGAK